MVRSYQGRRRSTRRWNLPIGCHQTGCGRFQRAASASEAMTAARWLLDVEGDFRSQLGAPKRSASESECADPVFQPEKESLLTSLPPCRSDPRDHDSVVLRPTFTPVSRSSSASTCRRSASREPATDSGISTLNSTPTVSLVPARSFGMTLVPSRFHSSGGIVPETQSRAGVALEWVPGSGGRPAPGEGAGGGAGTLPGSGAGADSGGTAAGAPRSAPW